LQLSYGRERIHDLIDEIGPLLLENYHEISRDLDIPLDPDWERYKLIEEQGNLRVYTARDSDDLLIGYCAFFVNYNLHYKSSLQAVQDVLYTEKERRGFGKKFIAWCDEQLTDEGVQKIYHHTKAKHNFGPMLETLGYELADLLYAKRADLVLSHD